MVLCFEDQVVIEHIYQALDNGRHLCCCLSFFNGVGLLFFFQSLVTMNVFFPRLDGIVPALRGVPQIEVTI
jgi:hypothetical protein